MKDNVFAFLSGAASAFALATITRFILGGYGGETEFMLFFLTALGSVFLAFPTLVSLSYSVWSALQRRFAQATGAAVTIALGFAVPEILMQMRATTPTLQMTKTPAPALLIFGPGLECYGSSACGSELVRAGYTIGAAGNPDTIYPKPAAGDLLYLTSHNLGADCKNSGKDLGSGFGLPPECVVWQETALPHDYIYIHRDIDAATDVETFSAIKGEQTLAKASREQVIVKTWSPFYVLGRVERNIGITNPQGFITALTDVKLGE
jgi:hypothetical protein